MINLLKIVLLTFFILNAHAKLNLTAKEKNYISSNTITLGTVLNNYPYSFKENNKITGFSHDYINLIRKKSGLRIKVEMDSWSNTLNKFKTKQIDLIDLISYQKNREAFTNFSKPYLNIPSVVFARKGEFNDYTGFESLKGKKVAITKGTYYIEDIKNLKLFELVEFTNAEDKMKALAYGKVDAIFHNLVTAQIAIKNAGYSNIKILDELDSSIVKMEDLRIGTRKENKILFSIINKSIEAITREEKELLSNKWFAAKIQKTTTKSNVYLTNTERSFLIKNSFDCVVSKSWAPFNFKELGKATGMSYAFWDLIKEKALIDSKCREVDSFDEVLNLIKGKKADLTIATAITNDKLSYGVFSIPYASYPIAIATTLDKRYISDTKSLDYKRVAVGKSYSSYQILKDKYPNIEFVEVENNLKALSLLSEGDVYAVVDILPVLSHIIADYGFKNLKISGTTEFNFDVRIMVRNDYEELIPIINKGIKSISKNESQEIRNRWLSVKFENLVNYSKLWEIGLIILIILLILFYRQYILNKHNKKLQEANNEIETKTIELQRKSRQLEKQKELFEKIYYESSDGILLSRIEHGEFIDCNEVAYKLLGYENKKEFLSLRDEDIIYLTQPDGSYSLDKIYEMSNIAIEKGSSQFELVHKKKDNTEVWLEVLITSITLDDEELLYIVWRDIQNRKYMEEELSILTNNLEEKVKKEVQKNEEKTKQLIQQSRLAQMGEMISMIAHQWRQPLTAISATTNNLLIRMLINEEIDKEEIQKEINLISDYSQHLSMTIDDFRNFFKTDKEKVETTLESVINNSISIVRSSLDAKVITLKTDFNCNKNLKIYATELNQVVLNLIKNAEDALTDNLIIIPEINIKTYVEDDCAVLVIEDNANGIPEDIIDKIFNPYFSTKKNKDGTGLGLYMSRIIINEHCNGILSVENINNGATFKVKIPL